MHGKEQRSGEGRDPRKADEWHKSAHPTAVVFNPKTDQIIVADSQRNRLQVYKKVRDYADFQANL